jgi:Transglutaminase-like superfamily
LPSLFPIARSALRLDAAARVDACRGCFWLVAARLALILLPYAAIARLVKKVGRRPSRRPPLSPERCAQAVRRAARLLPGSGCLPQALAAECLLRREGHDPRIVFGVAQGADGCLDAHAWVQNGDRIVIGGDTAVIYAPLRPAQRS